VAAGNRRRGVSAALSLAGENARLRRSDRAAARQELVATATRIQDWYEDLAACLAGRGELREPLPHDKGADGRFIEAVRHDLRTQDGSATATAVRMIWTADHLDAARRMQATLVGPVRTMLEQRALTPLQALLPRRAG